MILWAWAPPHDRTLELLSPDGDSRSVADSLVRLGALPAASRDNAAVEALIQADYRLAAIYTGNPATLECPLTVLGGTADRLVAPQDLDQWRERTRGAFRMTLHDGGHLLPQEHPAAIIAAVAALLAAP